MLNKSLVVILMKLFETCNLMSKKEEDYHGKYMRNYNQKTEKQHFYLAKFERVEF